MGNALFLCKNIGIEKLKEKSDMAYPNQYPQPYQYQYPTQVQPPMDRLAQLQAQQYQMPQQVMQPAPPQTNQGLLWVQGEAAARSYLVAPNTTVLLMDSESQVFYLKSTDNSGMPMPLRIFDYIERTQQNVPQNAPQSSQNEQTNLDDKYVTRQEYDALQAKYVEIMNKLDSFHVPTMVSEDARKSAAANDKSRNRGGNSNGKSIV